MSAIFDRVYELRIDTIQIGTTVSGRSAHNVSFEVERTLGRRPNRASVQVWNLDESQRTALEDRPATDAIQVELLAGYVESGPGLIFRGDLFNAKTVEHGGDLVTRIASRDGGGAHHAPTSRGYRPDSTIPSVVRGLVEDLGIGIGNLDDVVDDLRIGDSDLFSGGATFFGTASESLDRVFASAGHEWSVQDGVLQVLPVGRALGRTAIDLRPETGLSARPERTERGKVEVSTRLLPSLVPGVLVRLDGFGHRGTYRAESVRTAGELRSVASWGMKSVLGPVTS